MAETHIHIRGAREHNLQNVDLKLPRDGLIVITGVSGSGKSSLAFDTIYAEGQRRYVESLSAYARQFLGRMNKPDVDHIEGLSPAIAIDQKGVSHNPRSTVGTVTEIYDYLRLLYARIGHPHCPQCGKPVRKRTVQQIVDSLLKLNSGAHTMLLAPIVTHAKGEHIETMRMARQAGFTRIRVDNQIYDLDSPPKLDRKRWHSIAIVVDRIVGVNTTDRNRLAESVETALKSAQGTLIVATQKSRDAAFEDLIYSENFACPDCDISIHELEPRNFSFNTPYGACDRCTGLGFRLEIDPELVVPEQGLSLEHGAIAPWSSAAGLSPIYHSYLVSLAEAYGFKMTTPFKNLRKEIRDMVLYGSGGQRYRQTHTTRRGHTYERERVFEGVVPSLERRHAETTSNYSRQTIGRYMTHRRCASCQGQRLKPTSLAVTILDQNITTTTAQTVLEAFDWSKRVADRLSERERIIARQILKEINARLEFLKTVGLDYLTLDRPVGTISNGEGQRIRLATQIGSGLTGVLYVCDEPSIGLHPADGARLIGTLLKLRDCGNTVIVVEHDEAIMRAADHIVDMGPGAGAKGGKVVAQGSLDDIVASRQSLTGAYLSGRSKIPIPATRRRQTKASLDVIGAQANNLKNLTVKFPLGNLICVAGVSGSGKSTLVNEILSKGLHRLLHRSRERPGQHKQIRGVQYIDKVINVDQSPIGRTPRSNPATYTGLFTPLRDLFARLPESKARGYGAGRFSFNVKGGRCENCAGAGYIQVAMQFLPDVTVPCEECRGARYNREALEVKFKMHSIADALRLTVTEAQKLFVNIPPVVNKLNTLVDVGLGYIQLGQPATTLSGGEAQRIKLACELSKRATGATVYILDEPTTGLAFYDCDKLVGVLHKLVDAGNTMIVIEHHMDILKNADWLIDLGPGAGHAGGNVVATGTPEQVAGNPASLTGRYLSELAGLNPVNA